MHATPSEISITQINQRVIENTEFKKIAENPPKINKGLHHCSFGG